MDIESLLQVLNAQAGRVRREHLNGRDYIVAPFTSLRQGVLSGSKGSLFYPASEIEAKPGVWNHMPVTAGHPADPLTNAPQSARQPDVLRRVQLGNVYNDVAENGERRGEAWFDEELTRNRSPGVYKRLTKALLGNEVPAVELSTGLYTENIPAHNGANWHGKPYDAVATSYSPDHLAVFEPGTQRGACSVSDGCGVFNAEGIPDVGEWLIAVENANPEGHNQYTGTGQAGTFDKAFPFEVGEGVAKGRNAILADMEGIARGAASNGDHAEAAYQYANLSRVHRALASETNDGAARGAAAEKMAFEHYALANPSKTTADARKALNLNAAGTSDAAGAAVGPSGGSYKAKIDAPPPVVPARVYNDAEDDLDECVSSCAGDEDCIEDCLDDADTTDNAAPTGNAMNLTKSFWRRAFEALGFVGNSNPEGHNQYTGANAEHDKNATRHEKTAAKFRRQLAKIYPLDHGTIQQLTEKITHHEEMAKAYRKRIKEDSGPTENAATGSQYNPVQFRHVETGQYLPKGTTISSKQIDAAVKAGFKHLTGQETPPADDPDDDGDGGEKAYGRFDDPGNDKAAAAEGKESFPVIGNTDAQSSNIRIDGKPQGGRMIDGLTQKNTTQVDGLPPRVIDNLDITGTGGAGSPISVGIGSGSTGGGAGESMAQFRSGTYNPPTGNSLIVDALPDARLMEPGDRWDRFVNNAGETKYLLTGGWADPVWLAWNAANPRKNYAVENFGGTVPTQNCPKCGKAMTLNDGKMVCNCGYMVKNAFAGSTAATRGKKATAAPATGQVGSGSGTPGGAAGVGATEPRTPPPLTKPPPPDSDGDLDDKTDQGGENAGGRAPLPAANPIQGTTGTSAPPKPTHNAEVPMTLSEKQRREAVGYLTVNCACMKNKAEVLLNQQLWTDDDLVALVKNTKAAKDNELVANAARKGVKVAGRTLTFNAQGKPTFNDKSDGSNSDGQQSDGTAVEANDSKFANEGGPNDNDEDGSLEDDMNVGKPVAKKTTLNMDPRKYLQNADMPAALKAVFGRLVDNEEAEKTRLIGLLTANIRDPQVKARRVKKLTANGLDDLKDEAAGLPGYLQPLFNAGQLGAVPPLAAPQQDSVYGAVPSFLANGGAERTDNAEPDVLPLVTMNFKDEDAAEVA